MLDEITLYWLTNTGASSSRFYWDNNNNFSAEAQKTKDIKAPVGITVFPKEIHQAPESWAKHAHPSLTYYRQVEKGKHFCRLGTAATLRRGSEGHPSRTYGLEILCPLRSRYHHQRRHKKSGAA